MRMLRCLVVGLAIELGTYGVAAAAPKLVKRDAEPEVSQAQQAAQKTMAAELRRGRQLAQKGQRAEAIAAFEAALRAVPDEPSVLSELGWALRAAGELKRAEESCNKAVQAAKEPPLRAAALYNLGRVLEDKRDQPGAIAAYRASLKLRENRIVRERLLDLDKTAQSDALQPEPLEGPFPTVEAWCKKQPEKCALGKEASVSARVGKAPPWQEARLFTVGEGPEECVLALRTARGWFLGKPTYCNENIFRHDAKATLEWKDVLAPPGPKLLFSLRGTDSMRDYDEEAGHSICCLDADFEELMICGLGPSQVPHCTRTISLLPPMDAPKNAAETGLVPRYGGGELVLERADGKSLEDKKSRLAPTLQAIAGRHRIAFP